MPANSYVSAADCAAMDAEATHEQHDPTVTPNTRYYVSVVDGARSGFLLGPYDTHADALANVERGRELAEKRDGFAHFYAFGTCSCEGTRRTVFGK